MAERIAVQEMTQQTRQEAARLLTPYRQLIERAKERRFPFETITLPDGKCVPIVDAVLSCLRGVKRGLSASNAEGLRLAASRLERLEQIRVILEEDDFFEAD